MTRVAKKILNDPRQVVEEMIDGLVLANDGRVARACLHYLCRACLSLFCAPARRKERDVVRLHKRLTTPPGRKTARPFGLCPGLRHSALLVAHLE